MKKSISLVLDPEIALDLEKLRFYIRDSQSINEDFEIKKIRQSIDARKKNVKINLDLDIYINEPLPTEQFNNYLYPNIAKQKQVLIVGCGPAGIFAALRLIELGIKPIIFERGKDVKTRRRDIANINKKHIVDEDSNYCFGEGGAGTYSDGKLYTRAKKRGDIRRVLEILVNHGATREILVDAHPHIGTNKLPQVVAALRETIINAGGEIHFETKVTDFILKENQIVGLVTNKNDEYFGESVILATGHSARDIFELLYQHKITIENKPFAMGVRVEHSQNYVDTCQYHSKNRGLLPAASYSLVAQTHFNGIQRGVFSFCMCPGGFIVPASTAQNELVVNGMSPSRRDSIFANSGIVVAIIESLREGDMPLTTSSF